MDVMIENLNVNQPGLSLCNGNGVYMAELTYSPIFHGTVVNNCYGK